MTSSRATCAEILELAPRRRPVVRACIAAVALVVCLACAGRPDKAAKSGAHKAFAATPGSVLFVPATAHASGALGTNWRTDLELLNPGSERSTVTVALLRAGQSNVSPTQKTINIEAGRTARYSDVLSSLFGYSGAAALRISNSVGMVAVTSRTYNLTANGTYGQFVGGVLSPAAINAGQEGRLIQLTHNRATDSGFRTNIGFVNATGGPITIDVEMYAADGSFFGAKSYTLDPYGFRQVDKIFQQVTGGDVADGYAVLGTPTAGGAFFAYATVIDNRTGDPVYVTPVIRPASGGTVPPTATPRPTGSATPQPTPTRTPTPSPTPGAQVNLAPYQPSGWSGAVVVSGTAGTSTSGGLVGGATTYIDGAIINYGPGDVTFAPGQVVARVRLDGSNIIQVSYTQGGTLQANYYASFTDVAVNGIAAGQHTVSLVADADGLVAETNESDNTVDYSGTWSAAATGAGTGEEKVSVPFSPEVLTVTPAGGWTDGEGVELPMTVEWLGKPPLQPGPSAARKDVSYGDALYIPAAAHLSGAVGTNWRTDLELHNPGTAQGRYEVHLLRRDQSNTSPQVRTYTVNAGRSQRITDVLDSAFGFSGAAALRIEVLAGDLIASSRTYNQQPGGTYGQFAGGVNELMAFARGERAVLMQLTHDTATNSGFRTNVGMVNCSAATVNLLADFRGANGASLGTKTYTLRPWEYIQKDRIFRDVTANAVADGYVILTTDTADARFLAYATVVDNTTGDSVFIPAISVLGQEPAPINTLVATQAAFETMGLIGQGDVPSIEQVIADLQAYGIEQMTDIVIAQLPPGIVTHVEDGVRVDFGSHMVLSNGNILSGSLDAHASNVVITPTEVRRVRRDRRPHRARRLRGALGRRRARRAHHRELPQQRQERRGDRQRLRGLRHRRLPQLPDLGLADRQQGRPGLHRHLHRRLRRHLRRPQPGADRRRELQAELEHTGGP